MVKLISNNCPKCLILKGKLKDKGVEFTEEDDRDLLIENGMRSYPALVVDGEVMNFASSIKWVNEK